MTRVEFSSSQLPEFPQPKKKGKLFSSIVPNIFRSSRATTPLPADTNNRGKKCTWLNEDHIVQCILGEYQDKTLQKVIRKHPGEQLLKEELTFKKHEAGYLSKAFAKIEWNNSPANQRKLSYFLEFCEQVANNYRVQGQLPEELSLELRALLDTWITQDQMEPFLEETIKKKINNLSLQLAPFPKENRENGRRSEENRLLSAEKIGKVRKGKLTPKETQAFLSELVKELRQSDQQALGAISIQEFYRKAWGNKPDPKNKLKENGENISKMIGNTNFRTVQVANDIVSGSLSESKQMIEFYMQLCILAIKDGNFNAAMGIYGGLNKTAVVRLIEGIPSKMNKGIAGIKINPKIKREYEKAIRCLDPKGGFAQLTLAIANCKQQGQFPIPYLGKYLGELTFIEDGNPRKEDGKINGSRWMLAAETLDMLEETIETAKNAPRLSTTTAHFEPLPEERLLNTDDWDLKLTEKAISKLKNR